MGWYGEQAYIIMDLHWEAHEPYSGKKHGPYSFMVDKWSGCGIPQTAYKDIGAATEECQKRNRELARSCPVDLSHFYAGTAEDKTGVNCNWNGSILPEKFWDEDELQMRNLKEATDEEIDQILGCFGIKFCEIQEVELF